MALCSCLTGLLLRRRGCWALLLLLLSLQLHLLLAQEVHVGLDFERSSGYLDRVDRADRRLQERIHVEIHLNVRCLTKH